jgi:hypothetical protein
MVGPSRLLSGSRRSVLIWWNYLRRNERGLDKEPKTWKWKLSREVNAERRGRKAGGGTSSFTMRAGTLICAETGGGRIC